MARLIDQHAVVTFETRDKAPRHSLEKRALDTVRDAIAARDQASLDALREERLPEGWDPHLGVHLGAMVTKVAAWDAQQTATGPRPGDSVGFVGLGALSDRLEAQQAAARPTAEGFNHGRIKVALRFVLKSIAKGEQTEREQAAQSTPADDDTAVLPASVFATPTHPTETTVPLPRQGDPGLSERTVDLMASTRAMTLGALGIDDAPTGPIRLPGVDPDATGIVDMAGFHATRS